MSSRKPEYWPKNVAWKNSYIIDHVVETFPPIYVLTNGMEIRGMKPKQRSTRRRSRRRSVVRRNAPSRSIRRSVRRLKRSLRAGRSTKAIRNEVELLKKYVKKQSRRKHPKPLCKIKNRIRSLKAIL